MYCLKFVEITAIYSREGSRVEVSKITIYLGWKFHSIGFLISKFEFWRRFLAGKSKFTNKKSDGMEFPFQMRIIFETFTSDPSLACKWRNCPKT